MNSPVKLPYKIYTNPLWVVLGTLLLVIVPFLVWASYARLDRISHATGQVIAAAKTQEIQAAIDGVVEKIYVQEGMKVKKGDKLITLERSQAEAAYKDSKAKVAALKAALVRLSAEVYDKPLTFPDELKGFPDFVQNQKALFQRRQQALNDDLSTLKESLKLAKQELDMNLPLLKTGDISEAEVIRLKRQAADIEGRISSARNKYFQDSQTEMTKAEEELSTKLQEFADKSVTLERTVITSSMDAVVKNIILTTQGARVHSGDVILELVPFGDELIVETKMNPADVSFVKTGQVAAVKLDAYDYSIYGIFHGKVKHISPDTLLDKTAQGEKFYFRVLIALEGANFIAKNGQKIDITPGMATQVDIVTGDRTVLSYLTKPVTKTFSEALHER